MNFCPFLHFICLGIKVKCKILFFIFTIILLQSCDNGSLQIVDYYRVYDYMSLDNHGNSTDAKNVLMCKLGCKNDAFIEEVIKVEWNDSTIIVKTKNGYFSIEGNDYGLCCCCENKSLGPMNPDEIEQYKRRRKFVANQTIFRLNFLN